MRHWPSRLRRLDDALAALPIDEAMLLSELDGYLTAILLSPEPVAPEEWLQGIWGTDESGVPPFENPADVRWFADAVTAHLGGIARDVARGKPQPVFEVDERNGDVLWEIWIEGFVQAMDLRPEAWDAVAEGDGGVADAMAQLATLIAVTFNESDLDSVQVNALQDAAPATIVDVVVQLYAARSNPGTPPIPAIAPTVAVKVGRNDPCVCGSGRKSKRCCGA